MSELMIVRLHKRINGVDDDKHEGASLMSELMIARLHKRTNGVDDTDASPYCIECGTMMQEVSLHCNDRKMTEGPRPCCTKG